MSLSSGKHRCVICRRNKGDCESLKMHRFPKNVNRCQKWVATLNIPFLYQISPQVLNSKYVVCSTHFEPNQYINGRLLHSAVPVKNLIKYKCFVAGDRKDVFCEIDSTLLQKEEWMKKNFHEDAVRNLCDKDDWPNLEFTPGFYDTNLEFTTEVRVGPSFINCDVEPPSNPVNIHLHGEVRVGLSSNCDVEPPSNPVNIHLHDEGEDIADLPLNSDSDDNSSDHIVINRINPDEVSDSEDNAMKDSTLECIVSNPSARFISKEGSILCCLEKKTTMFAKHLDASYFEKHLNWIAQHKKKVTEIHTDDPPRTRTSKKKSINARKSSRQVLFHPSHEALKFKKHVIGCSGQWNTYGFSLLEEQAQSFETEDKLCGIVLNFLKLAGVTKAKVKPKRKSLSNISDSVMKLENPSTFCGLVIMVKGLQKKWKCILRYDIFANTVQAEDIKEMLKSCILMLQDISYEVKFMVCNSDPVNKLLKDLLGITYSKPYFTVGKEKVFFYFDPCDLLQNTLNEFIKTDVHVGNNVATWKYVQSFLQKESEKEYKLAPNLSLLNGIPVYSEGFSGSENNVALEVFSHAVSAGIYKYATSGLLPEEAVHTATFVHTLNELMNYFLKSKPNDYKNVSKSKASLSEHMEEVLELESVLKTWKIANVDYKGGINPIIKRYYNKKRKSVSKGDTVKNDDKLFDLGSWEIDPLGLIDDFKPRWHQIDNFIPRWLCNVSALKQMWKELHNEFEVKHLCTQNISQNCSEDIMAAIKKHNKNDSSPNVTDFEIAIQNLLCPSFDNTSYLSTL